MPSFLPRLAVLVLAVLPLVSCNGDIFGHTVQVKAQYLNLAGHTAAVLVSTPDHVLDPDAASDIGQAVTRRIMDNVKGVTMVPYSRSQAFVEANPYWTTRPPSSVQKALGVDRLIVVDVAEFKTHEEGSNGELLQGVASGYIRVLEAENKNADNFVLNHLATSNYPPLRRSTVGLPEGFGDTSRASVRWNRSRGSRSK